jgi:zinc D-Ala-D-Ala carboxypeptidase
MQKISEHISYKEATLSPTAVKMGIPNDPDAETLKRMQLVADKCFEQIRAHYGKPIQVTSFYRSAKLNAHIGGSATLSQHILGEAIDFDCGKDNAGLFEWIKKNLEYDQLIWEYGTDQEPDWIHISYTERKPNRQETLRVKGDRTGNKVWSHI